MLTRTILTLLLVVAYILVFGRRSVSKYLDGAVTINRKEKIIKNIQPPGTADYISESRELKVSHFQVC